MIIGIAAWPVRSTLAANGVPGELEISALRAIPVPLADVTVGAAPSAALAATFAATLANALANALVAVANRRPRRLAPAADLVPRKLEITTARACPVAFAWPLAVVAHMPRPARFRSAAHATFAVPAELKVPTFGAHPILDLVLLRGLQCAVTVVAAGGLASLSGTSSLDAAPAAGSIPCKDVVTTMWAHPIALPDRRLRQRVDWPCCLRMNWGWCTALAARLVPREL
mmetsp:Transcript_99915/g.282065  ORF Transcript_99915/g.282065 Transcript_99915/m.282065 type:complete len:228 (-) Transcript_99915:181-864(-)